MSARTLPSFSATTVVNEMRAVPPDGMRSFTRRLTIGSSTAPTDPLSGLSVIIAAGNLGWRPRPMKRSRSVSNSTRLPVFHCPASTWPM